MEKYIYLWINKYSGRVNWRHARKISLPTINYLIILTTSTRIAKLLCIHDHKYIHEKRIPQGKMVHKSKPREMESAYIYMYIYIESVFCSIKIDEEFFSSSFLSRHAQSRHHLCRTHARSMRELCTIHARLGVSDIYFTLILGVIALFEALKTKIIHYWSCFCVNVNLVFISITNIHLVQRKINFQVI